MAGPSRYKSKIRSKLYTYPTQTVEGTASSEARIHQSYNIGATFPSGQSHIVRAMNSEGGSEGVVSAVEDEQVTFLEIYAQELSFMYDQKNSLPGVPYIIWHHFICKIKSEL